MNIDKYLQCTDPNNCDDMQHIEFTGIGYRDQNERTIPETNYSEKTPSSGPFMEHNKLLTSLSFSLHRLPPHSSYKIPAHIQQEYGYVMNTMSMVLRRKWWLLWHSLIHKHRNTTIKTKNEHSLCVRVMRLVLIVPMDDPNRVDWCTLWASQCLYYRCGKRSVLWR